MDSESIHEAVKRVTVAMGKVKQDVNELVTGGNPNARPVPSVFEPARLFNVYLDTAYAVLHVLAGSLVQQSDAGRVDDAAERELRVMAGSKVD
jgi:hypothetical protein